MMLKLVIAESAEQIQVTRELFREYQAFLNVDLCFQDFEAELAGLPGKYENPTGAILLAEYAGKIAGCVAVRGLDKNTCEMKRLFVKDEFRGLSIGRVLAESIVAKARELGYQKMQLDTLQRLDKAMSLYQKLGFKQTKAYYDNPLSEVVYWELELSA